MQQPAQHPPLLQGLGPHRQTALALQTGDDIGRAGCIQHAVLHLAAGADRGIAELRHAETKRKRRG
jgi:hypothetical protein